MANSMIRPGLERMKHLLLDVPQSWAPVHVAGTNGKGSTCAYISAMLHACDISTGRFTSPHLFHRWDCITINEKPVKESLFREVENWVKARDATRSINATPFELLTATAFEIFNRAKISIGVVECGMGGRLDATNVLKDPLVTVITQLGMDHQAFLGDSEHEIAWEKAGIMKKGVPCVVNSFSRDAFMHVLVARAKELDVKLFFTPLDGPKRRAKFVPRSDNPSEYRDLFKGINAPIFSTQRNNMWCAYRTFQVLEEKLPLLHVNHKRIVQAMARTRLPGRFQKVSLEGFTGRKNFVLVDGAHNRDAFIANFSGWIHLRNRQDTSPRQKITWVVACSNGRDPMEVFSTINPDETVFVTEFGPVDDMPWVTPVPGDCYKPIIQRDPIWFNMGTNIRGALIRACEVAKEGPLIVAGSLYLVADVLRILRDEGVDITRDVDDDSPNYKSLDLPSTAKSRTSDANSSGVDKD